MGYSIRVLMQVVIMLIITFVGVFSYKKDILTKEAGKKLSGFVLNIVVPCFIFMSYQTDYSYDMLIGMGMALILSVATHIIFILVSMIIIRKKPNSEYIIERFSLIYTNCGFMGIPLIEGVFGTEGVLYATTYLTVFNLFVWTHGLLMMKNEFSIKGFLNVLKSPSIIAICIGLICYLAKIRIPEIFAKPLNYIGSMNTPLAMVTAGITIAQTNIKSIIKNVNILKISLLRLFVFPVVAIVILSFLPVPDEVFMSSMLAAACPTAAIGTLFAVQYDKNAVYASEIFSVTTILSAISMPLMILCMEFIR